MWAFYIISEIFSTLVLLGTLKMRQQIWMISVHNWIQTNRGQTDTHVKKTFFWYRGYTSSQMTYTQSDDIHSVRRYTPSQRTYTQSDDIHIHPVRWYTYTPSQMIYIYTQSDDIHSVRWYTLSERTYTQLEDIYTQSDDIHPVRWYTLNQRTYIYIIYQLYTEESLKQYFLTNSQSCLSFLVIFQLNNM